MERAKDCFLPLPAVWVLAYTFTSCQFCLPFLPLSRVCIPPRLSMFCIFAISLQRAYTHMQADLLSKTNKVILIWNLFAKQGWRFDELKIDIKTFKTRKLWNYRLLLSYSRAVSEVRYERVKIAFLYLPILPHPWCLKQLRCIRAGPQMFHSFIVS